MTERPDEALDGPRNTRIPSIDLLRGLVIIVMALDHVHDFFGDLTAQPTNLTLGKIAPLWTLLHAPGILLNTGRSVVFVSYVLIPWIGVTALGYTLGAIYAWSSARRQKLLSWLGAGLIATFIALRFVNFYGDPARWSPQDSTLWTVISFVNTTKYPPSLLFLLMTLGPALLLLRSFEKRVPSVFGPAVVVGKVPLFFYVVHFYIIHLLAVGASYIRYGKVDEMFQSPDLGHFPFSQPPGWDVGLPMIYLLWLIVLVIMFPLCRWYAQVKRTRGYWWLSYL